MADVEHLEQLSQGITRWNQWREDNPEIYPNLCDADLSRANLSNADFHDVNLSRAALCGADLSDADLGRADLRDADLSDANLSRANLSGFGLQNTDWRDSVLRGADLSGCNLCGATLLQVNLSGADLSRTNLHKADLRDTTLSRANLYGASLTEANLSGANLSGLDLTKCDINRANLSGADLSRAKLNRANLSGFDLSYSNLREVDFGGADLRGAYLRKSDLRGAALGGADLCGANLFDVDLRNADLIGARLNESNLRDADLRESYLNGAHLGGADLCGTDLRRADLRGAQVLKTSLERAKFTGACLEDWNINSTTSFDGAICDYVYLTANHQERRPREGSFDPGEFAALFQQVVDTVDLIFKDGIDWQAFFQSFQDLRNQYADQNLSIQAIEKKQGGAFIVRLEVSEDANKSAIESSSKQLYEAKLTLLEQRYRAELQAKDGEIVAYREQSANLMKITEMLAARPPMSEGNKYDMRGAQFGGGYVAGNVEGNQYGGIINNYGSNAEDITRLLSALRDQAQTFPADQKDDANDTLDDLERDLAEEQPDQNRIGRRLKKLVALAAAIGTIASGAAAVSGDVSTFTGNVIELTEQLGIPIERVQLPSSNQP